MSANTHGLARNIPEAVKRQVRQECGFGCILCGSTIIEYEHFGPEFKDAKGHDPSGIALLCPTHHAQKTKGILPSEHIAEARLHPFSRSTGFIREKHPYFRGLPTVNFGSTMEFISIPVPIMVKGKPVFQFSEGENGAICNVSMKFEDSTGNSVLTVKDNEWIVSTDLWDFQSVGNRYKIRCADGRSSLEMVFSAPNKILFEKTNIFIDRIPVIIDKDVVRFASFQGSRISMSHSNVGFAIG